MASDTSRPSTNNGGSRPPTSRFVEGSMNDRISAEPPPRFLGPDQLKNFERQFYVEPPDAGSQKTQRRTRRDRPFSESSAPEQANLQEEHIITHRKSTGFFGRVRDALGWGSASRHNNAQKHESARKHSSLQEPLRQQPPLQPPRLDHGLRAVESHPEMYNIPQLANLGGSGPRPTRDEVLQSYNQLMATGFFQSHAIQSTRHAGPGSRGNDRRSAPPVPPMPPMPSIPGSAPCSPDPPPRTSSIDVTARPTVSPCASPKKSSAPAAPRARVASHHRQQRQQHRGRTPSRPEEAAAAAAATLKSMESNQSLRGRKRNRADADDGGAVTPTGSAEAGASEAAVGGSSAPSASSSFAQPLKRVAKKLRKTPASNTAARDAPTPDGIVGLPPSTSVGGTVYQHEKGVRLRSPSPQPAQTPIPATRQRQPSATPRRTFSSSSSSRSDGNRLRKRGKSASLRSRTRSASGAAGAGPDAWDDGAIYQDATATAATDDEDEDDRKARDALSVVPDANRGIPSVPRIPDRYHYYHKPGAPKGRYYREDATDDDRTPRRRYENAGASESAKPRVYMHPNAQLSYVQPDSDAENRGRPWQFGEAL
ncbi:hypothetical protein GGR52DRAFT_577870 [Hypoxylon sp. FL1284]|nr:hypothetical protein GGR52DRAFT_577870 [Hypoxylon sp. FL1284]